LKLTNVAKASLEELRLDYEDFLRQRNLVLWEKNDPRRKALVAQRCQNADEVAAWVRRVYWEKNGQDGRNGHSATTKPPSIKSISFIKSIPSIYAETAANAALVLIGVAIALLNRQVASQAKSFENEGGFTERLYRVRKNTRD